MRPYQVRAVSIADLHRQLDRGEFAVPHLQREFVWNGKKAAALIDSILRGMPIGGVLVWETDGKDRHLLRNSLHILPSYNPANKTIQFLIDGQQRLSVLYQAMRGDAKTNSSGRTVDFGRLCLDVTSKRTTADPLCQYRKPDDQWVPLPDLLHPHWRNRLKHLTVAERNRASTCRSAILRYRVPVVYVTTAKLDEIRELFVRINSLGTPVGSADRVFARASTIDLRHLARHTRDCLPDDFADLRYETLLQGFAFLSDEGSDVGERAYNAEVQRWERRLRKNPDDKKILVERWTKFERAFSKAVTYLASTFRIADTAHLPSANLLATLAVFFYYHKGQPSPSQQREVRKWFWATSVGQRYTGRGFRENVLADVRFFRRMAQGAARFTLAERFDPQDIRRTEYTRASGISAAFFALLAIQGPRYLQNGSPVPPERYAGRAHRKDRHHIFPRALLQRHGVSYRLYNSLCNICYVVAEENQSIGSNRPSSYLDNWSRKRFFARAAQSHLLPIGKDSGLWDQKVKHGFARFMDQRLSLVTRAFEREAGMKLFRR